MNRTRILTSAAVLATLSLAAAPAFAQQHGGGHSRASSASHGSSRGTAARSAAPSRAYAAPSRTYSAAPRAALQSRGVYAAPVRFFRPYYSFRPRFSLGFGVWVGYPIAYASPFYYGYPYDSYAYPEYDPPPAYGDVVPNPASYPPGNYPTASAPQPGDFESGPPQGSIVAQPGAASGGVSFEISPATAEVYIDGKPVGRVSDLGPTTQPLALVPGRHHIEIRADGYQTLSVDADITAGQVIPYQGTMQPVR